MSPTSAARRRIPLFAGEPAVPLPHAANNKAMATIETWRARSMAPPGVRQQPDHRTAVPVKQGGRLFQGEGAAQRPDRVHHVFRPIVKLRPGHAEDPPPHRRERVLARTIVVERAPPGVVAIPVALDGNARVDVSEVDAVAADAVLDGGLRQAGARSARSRRVSRLLSGTPPSHAQTIFASTPMPRRPPD